MPVKTNCLISVSSFSFEDLGYETRWDEILGLYYSKTAILHPFKLYQRSQRKVVWEGTLALLPWPWRNDSIKSSSAPPRPPCPRKSYICQSNSFLVWVRNCDIFSFSSQTFGTTLLLLSLGGRSPQICTVRDSVTLKKNIVFPSILIFLKMTSLKYMC